MLTWLELGAGEAIFAAVVLGIASFIRGYSGFGFSAVLVAGLAFVVEPLAAVPLAIAFEVAASIVQGQSVRHEIRWKDFWTLLIAAIIGNPVGVLILTTVDGDALRGATFGVLFVLSLVLLLQRTARIEPTTALVFGVGVVAGVVNGATAMSGLVLVLAMSFIVISAAEMRATLVAYFFASDLVVLVVLGVRRELPDELFWRVILGLPLLAAGVLVGSRAFRSATQASFRQNTLRLLCTISVVGIARLII
ncbi:sulfite exporter TauE/SafE family protein [Ilumatobacter sp.]|uniref:sulfite exporter TauE/SafE family protein n=1 Tax=Ilumatobacter sp. TaxID=1967498 RepID=UPI003750BE9F